ncbi:MAG: hypothetical protein JXR83_01465 [Deltaproteobacteria bacterium]|nr:hypothetical protein [Deltaproteobacteria bacterium]
MPFAYYQNLGQAQKRTYDRSDAIVEIPVPGAGSLSTEVDAVAQALSRDDRAAVQRALQRLCDAMTAALRVAPVQLKTLAARPADDWGELQGLYQAGDDDNAAQITVWMRTAQRRQPVAFRTFLRTFVHELCHHLDFELFKLDDTFHTEGFFKRESHLMHQLLGAGEGG